MAYDSNNIFARILKGEIPCKKVYEDNDILSFHDINPKAPVHVLVIPKGAYINYSEFAIQAPSDVQQRFHQMVSQIAQDLGLSETGYRLIMNCGTNGGQEVPHFHVHILGGKRLGAMIGSEDI